MVVRFWLLLILLSTSYCKPSVKYIDPNKKGATSSSGDGTSSQTGDSPGTTGGDTGGSSSGSTAGDSSTTGGSSSGGTTGTVTNSSITVQASPEPIRAKQPVIAPTINVTSADPNLTYVWTTKSGPGTLVFKPSNVLQPEISASVDGEYVALLTVSDSSGSSVSKEFPFIWDTSPPQITMPADIRTLGPVAVAGAVVTDLDKNVTLSWRLLVPSSGLTFDNASVLEPTVTPQSETVYVLELAAKDTLGNQSSGYMTVERYRAVTSTGPEIKTGSNLITSVPAKPSVEVTSTLPPLTYKWVTTSGPASLTFTAASDLTPVISAPMDGVYVATLTVTDAQKVSAVKSVVVVWDTQAPVITLDTPMTISRPTQPLISATDTSWKISYIWEQLSGPGVLTFSNPSIVNPFISASVAGTYTARISATDAAGNRSSKTLSVIWSIPDSLAPVIRVGNPLTAFSPTQVRDVTATDSDPNLIYKWDQISGPGRLTFTTVDRLLPVITADQVGDYVARITATDTAGNRGQGYLLIQWTSGDKTPPVIAMTTNMTISKPTAPAMVAVTDASPVTLLWSQVSGPGTLLFSNAAIAAPLISATAAGTYVARLTATDSSGNQSSSDLVLVWVVPDTRAPQVNMGALIRSAVSFEPRSVTVSDDDPQLTYTWSQAGGPGVLNFSSGTALYPTISASVPGNYLALLTVKDRQGNTSSGLLNITWYIPDQTVPVVSMGPSLRFGQPTKLSQVSASDNDSNLSYLWEKVTGPGNVSFAVGSQLQPTVSMDVDGTYVVQLTVWDSAGNKASGTLTIVWDRTPPVVFAGATRTKTAAFVVDDSRVTDISPVTMVWRVVSKPFIATVTISNTADLHPTIRGNYPGNYVLELTATDAVGLSASSRLNFTMNLGAWVPTNKVACSQVCQSSGRTPGRSPEGAQCASGENVAASAVPWVTFTYGCWPGCAPTSSTDSSSVSGNCYKSGQKRDNDRTDITVGCYCI